MSSYIDQHPLSGAFLAIQLERLAGQISNQGDALLQAVGIDVPSRTVSTVLLIGESDGVSAADISDRLQLPHQLVTQRVERLIELGLVARTADVNDRRRKVLALTERGRDQDEKLRMRLAAAVQVFEELFAEINCNLPECIRKASDALDHTPLVERAEQHLAASTTR